MKNNSDRPLADALRAWRSSHGLSQAAAAGLLGVPTRTLQGWEQGRTTPWDQLIRWAMIGASREID